jgi:putative RecB family exonuclease
MNAQAAIFRSGSLDESKPGDPLAYLSASRLKSFLTCRLKFYFERVLGLKAPSSPNLQIGKAVHAGLQHFHTARWRGDDASLKPVLAAYRKAYSELEAGDPVDYGSKDRENSIATGERVLLAYLDSILTEDPRRICGVEVYLRSENVGLPLPLVGVLDLVRDGPAPIDFKTVGASPDLNHEAWANEIQLTCYHLLLADATGETPDHGELVYLVKTKTPKVIRHELPAVTDTQLDRLKALSAAYVAGITREEFYPSAGMHCRWCAFRSDCAAWSGVNARAA